MLHKTMTKIEERIQEAVKAHYKKQEGFPKIIIEQFSGIDIELPEPHKLHTGNEVERSCEVFFLGRDKWEHYESAITPRHVKIHGMKIRYKNQEEDYEIVSLGKILP